MSNSVLRVVASLSFFGEIVLVSVEEKKEKEKKEA